MPVIVKRLRKNDFVLAASLIFLFGGALIAPSLKALLVALVIASVIGLILEIVFTVLLFKWLWI